MAVLRIADYKQIEASRAPQDILKTRQLWSPTSRQEWKKHSVVRDISIDEADPESIWIDVVPKDVKTFLKLRRFFHGLQYELDKAWACLGEIYGADPTQCRLGLRYRRIRSSLDDKKGYLSSVEFLPEDLCFRPAGGELLTLLVGPLYGHLPQYGIRELLQNAVDACREINDFLNQNPDQIIDRPCFEGDVLITLEELPDGGGCLTVEDKGIGMTVDVVRDYFLTAGASFRRSNAWTKLHSNANGKARVIRSGRFGVGVLASFLIGSEIEVSTRHVTQKEGLSFRCTMTTEHIEATKLKRPVGTTIKVWIDDLHVLDTLLERKYTYGGLASNWDWYALSKPTVICQHKEKDKPLTRRRQEICLPDAGEECLPMWHRISHPLYNDIQWTFHVAPPLWCNGILIAEIYQTADLGSTGMLWNPVYEGFHKDTAIPIGLPHLSVFDSENALPLNLLRSGRSDVDPQFKSELLDSVTADVIVFILSWLDEFFDSHDSIDSISTSIRDALIGDGIITNIRHDCICEPDTWRWLCFTCGGIAIPEAGIVSSLNPNCIWFTPLGWNEITERANPPLGTVEILQRWPIEEDAISHMESPRKSISTRWVLTGLLGKDPNYDEGEPDVNFERYFHSARYLECLNRFVLLTEMGWNSIEKNVRRIVQNSLIIEKTTNGYILLTQDNVDLSRQFIKHLIKDKPLSPNQCVVIWNVKPNNHRPDMKSPLEEQWLKLLGGKGIPLDSNKRHNNLREIYLRHSKEINDWREYLRSKREHKSQNTDLFEIQDLI